MNGPHLAGLWRTGLLVVGLCGGVAAGAAPAEGPDLAPGRLVTQVDDGLPPPRPVDKTRPKLTPEQLERLKKIQAEVEAALPQLPDSILPKEMNTVDLGCVLKLAGVENPEILIARQRVALARAERFFALAQLLPNLNLGANYDTHTGPLQQSSGNILQVNRSAFYLGAGAGAVAAGTPTIPGVLFTGNVSEGLFRFLAIRQTVRVREFESLAMRNQIFLQVCQAYMELLRAEGRRAVALQNQKEAFEIARLTGSYARTGLGNQSDADRAAAELAQRNEDVMSAEREVLVSSANLAALINLPPSIQMHAIDGWVVPTPIVPDATSMNDLLGVALRQRPELAARQAAIRAAIMLLRNEQFLPFSPTVIAGFSAGTFGGGSNLVAQPGGFQGFAESEFGNFAARDDVDVIMFWTAQNAGVGNLARIRRANVERSIAQLELIRELNRVRNDVAVSYAGIHARYAQINIAERGIKFGYDSFKEDLGRIIGGQGLPIELLDSFRLAADARYNFLNALVNYNRDQFGLYVALGQPPAKTLAQALPGELTKPAAPAPPLTACAPPDAVPPAGPPSPFGLLPGKPPETGLTSPANASSGDGSRRP